MFNRKFRCQILHQSNNNTLRYRNEDSGHCVIFTLTWWCHLRCDAFVKDAERTESWSGSRWTRSRCSPDGFGDVSGSPARHARHRILETCLLLIQRFHRKRGGNELEPDSLRVVGFFTRLIIAGLWNVFGEVTTSENKTLLHLRIFLSEEPRRQRRWWKDNKHVHHVILSL